MTESPDWYRPAPRLTEPQPSRPALGRRARRFVLLVFFAPLVLGFAATFLIGWPYVSAAETGLMLFGGCGGILGVVGARRYHGPESSQSFLFWTVNVWKHRRLLAIGAAILAVYGLGQAAADTADWFFPNDHVDVTIVRSGTGGRSSKTWIDTTTGARFYGPMFWSFPVEPGVARLTLGHVSRHVLLVEQPATP